MNSKTMFLIAFILGAMEYRKYYAEWKTYSIYSESH